jgi:hypothetical protein
MYKDAISEDGREEMVSMALMVTEGTVITSIPPTIH